MVIQKKTPQRMCVGCQEMKNKKELLRIVRTPDDDVILDPTGKKSGRGAYLCCNEQCLAKAFKEKRLERALKRVINPEIYEQLRSGIIT
ncbi:MULTISPECIES: RNase P modulator RnpM [Pelosinus]|uniref:YlxR domain-containing protein n=1 Tax=Pelosinus fermentans B4 TaxID=1149862 RepID=I9LDV4_9FIRM|nr:MULTISPECIES: YlxR family protein [Pelosinus]EIW18531.1 protein of unknown function DUF448 [Pelosinus fermentans B4]EIW24545.1 protein of unknown function DUF448 [Pelosinus fermentans A11]OAM94397.1 protein of unknown function DUF448 [Pelosinus fermentans DSM 17108]SDR08055.1 hypothetical protein SAMN04515679_2520 [Pelosinus fermentans]